jgi:hypothetical protein
MGYDRTVRSLVSWLRTLVLLAVTLPMGCRWLAGYDGVDAPVDSAIRWDVADSGAKDGPRADTPLIVVDAGAPDDASRDVLHDVLLDGGMAADTSSDLVAPSDSLFHTEAGSCIEQESVVQTKDCADQRVGCGKTLPSDTDCDGLPDALDPDSKCNALEHNEPFSVSLSGWAGSFNPYLGCGVELPGGSFWSLGTYPTGDKLWLLGLRYQSNPYVKTTKLTLSKQVGNGHYAACVLQALSSSALELKVEVKTPPNAADGVRSATQTSALSIGDYFSLASWADGKTFTCAVHDERGKELLRASTTHPASITNKAEVRITTTGVSVWLDHVRIFARAP